MGSIVIRSLSILLGLFFLFVGLLKISCYFSKDLHRDLRKDYVKYAKVFPFSQLLGFKIPSKWYRTVIGWIELVCGFSLAFIPIGLVKNIANTILILTMALSVYSHYMITDRFERIAPALVFFFMLIGRMVIEWQLNRQICEVNDDIRNQKQD